MRVSITLPMSLMSTCAERENKILLGKMYSIMNAEPAYKTDVKVSVASLNMTVRKQEYDRIARENQAIMQRILQRESNFKTRQLEAVCSHTSHSRSAPCAALLHLLL